MQKDQGIYKPDTLVCSEVALTLIFFLGPRFLVFYTISFSYLNGSLWLNNTYLLYTSEAY